ncbi:MAG: hemolysin III family protein [Pseudomonadota bacterium]
MAAALTRRHDIPPAYPVYSRREKVADGVVHALGVLAALTAVPVMITLAAVWHGDLPTVAAATIYGLSLIAMFAFSASYHMVGHGRAKALLKRFDHGAIFIKIAGTYTPFAVLLGGAQAATILISIWSAALVGIILVLTSPRGFQWLALGLYLAMGWAVIVLGGQMLEDMSGAGLALIIIGGGLYSFGVIFHLWDRLPYQNAIWHAHVLAASVVFYAAIMVEVGRSAP